MQHRRLPATPAVTQVALRADWEAFQSAGTIGESVRPEIAASWRRAAQARLTPQLLAAPLDEAALRGFDNSGQARQQFMAASRALADHLIEELDDATAAVVVCDDFGVVLYRAGRRDVLRTIDGVNLVPGGVWSEKTTGTTGIGLALAMGGPAHVYAAEHYVEALHGFSCTAAIVRHPVTREMLGVLGLATDASISATFARPLMVRAALDVERLLEDQVFGRERELMEHYLRNRAGHPAPFLTVDRAGHTVIQNARMLQSASGEDVQLLLSVARQALTAEADTVEQLELSRGSSHAEVRLVHDGPEVLGALVSLDRAGRGHGRSAFPVTLDWSPLVGRSAAMQRLFREAAQVARQRMAVAVQGEPGTGKLMLAEHLHRLGGEGPLTLVHCARPEWERELAEAMRTGGTAILRRVHALTPEAQLKLCDRLDELAERPPGHPDLWVISVGNTQAAPPCDELQSRLARVSLMVPALRDRGHDLRLLVDHWCDERERATGTRPVLRPEAHEALAAQPWPGNVRELHNALDAAALRSGTVIGVESLALATRRAPGGSSPGSRGGNLRDLEREAISAALERTGGNVSRAARELGIGRATLHRRLRAYRLLRDAAPTRPTAAGRPDEPISG